MPMLTILLFGRLRDQAEGGRIDWPLEAPRAVADIVEAVKIDWPGLAAAMAATRVRWALNGAMLAEDDAHTEAKPGDELALLPPVSGG